MAAEIWLWIREQVARLFGSIGHLFVKLWRWFTGWLGSISGSTWRRVVLAVPALFALYILIGMPLTNRIDDTLPLGQPSYATHAGSRWFAWYEDNGNGDVRLLATREDGTEFEIEIPAFSLDMPDMLRTLN